jgi:hypothetical protein
MLIRGAAVHTGDACDFREAESFRAIVREAGTGRFENRLAGTFRIAHSR